jgi:hypothetical protein
MALSLVDQRQPLHPSQPSTGNVRVELGSGRTGDGIAYIDLLGDTTYTDYGTRILRNATANGTTDLRHRGTGGLQIIAQEAAPIQFYTTDTERMRITSGGTFVVGTTAGLTSELIHARASSGTISTLYNSGATGDVLRLYHENTAVTAFSIWGGGAQRGFITSPVSNNGLIFGTSSTERMRLDSSGNMSIGTSTSDALLYARRTSGTTAPIGRFEAAIGAFTGTSLTAQNTLGTSNTYNLFTCVTDSDGDSGGPYTLFQVRGDGRVGILGSSINQSALRVNGSISVTSSDTDFGAGGNRAMIDLAGSVARMGAMNGGGGAVELALYSASAERMRSETVIDLIVLVIYYLVVLLRQLQQPEVLLYSMEQRQQVL